MSFERKLHLVPKFSVFAGRTTASHFEAACMFGSTLNDDGLCIHIINEEQWPTYFEHAEADPELEFPDVLVFIGFMPDIVEGLPARRVDVHDGGVDISPFAHLTHELQMTVH
jgi:hypothetical protein